MILQLIKWCTLLQILNNFAPCYIITHNTNFTPCYLAIYICIYIKYIYIYIYTYTYVYTSIYSIYIVKWNYLHEFNETLASLSFLCNSRGVSRIQSKIYDWAFLRNCWRLLVFNSFRKKSPSEMFDWVLNTLVNLNNTLKNLKIVLLYLQKYRLSGRLVFYT